MSYYYYGSNIIQNLTTLETLTLTSSGFTYKNSTTTFIPWSTLSNINSILSVSSLNVSSANFSSIDSNISTLNIGAVNATTINIGKSNTSVNVVSGIFNASYFTLSSTTFGGASNCCLLDTSIKGTLTTQFSIGQSNSEEVYIGNGIQNKKVVIGNIANTANTINIGNASSTVTMNASSLNIGSENSKQINVGVTDLNTTFNGQIHIGPYYYFNTEKGVYINDACSDNNQVTLICTNSSSRIQIGCANGTRTSPLSLYGNIRINPDGINNSTTIGCATVPTIINTKLTVDGSAVNSTTNIMTIKQNTGSHTVITDFKQDPFSITSPNSGTLSVNNSYYDNLTLGMGVDTTYNFAYINCAMFHAIRPIVIGGREGGDTYIGYVPTDLNKTSVNSGGNLLVKGYVFPKGDVLFNNDGSGLRWGGVGGGVSRIVDDGTLKICTDDWMLFNTGCNSTALGDTKMRIDTSNTTIYNNFINQSDIKVKRDIITVNNALDKVLALRGVYFTYIKTNTRSIGVIAQEVQEVLPEIVIDVEGTLAVSYISFSGVFIEAIKEMKADYDKKITDLERRLSLLESKP